MYKNGDLVSAISGEGWGAGQGRVNGFSHTAKNRTMFSDLTQKIREAPRQVRMTVAIPTCPSPVGIHPIKGMGRNSSFSFLRLAQVIDDHCVKIMELREMDRIFK